MKLEHTFTVPVPVDQAWEVLLDLERVAPCMPGATLTGVDGAAFTGAVKVKLGPIMLTYNGKGRFVERDEAARRVVVEASGRDTRSSGTAGATVTAQLVDQGVETRVDVVTDLTVTGRPAQFGRSMISDVSTKLLGQFADSLAATLAEPASPSLRPTSPPAPTSPAAPADVPPERPAVDDDPIDLLRLTGSTDLARRAAAAGAGVVLLAVVAWVVVRLFRRR